MEENGEAPSLREVEVLATDIQSKREEYFSQLANSGEVSTIQQAPTGLLMQLLQARIAEGRDIREVETLLTKQAAQRAVAKAALGQPIKKKEVYMHDDDTSMLASKSEAGAGKRRFSLHYLCLVWGRYSYPDIEAPGKGAFRPAARSLSLVQQEQQSFPGHNNTVQAMPYAAKE